MITNMRTKKNEIVSAHGPEYIMPSSPKKSGRIRMSGMKKSTERVSENTAPRNGFPIDAKRFEDVT